MRLPRPGSPGPGETRVVALNKEVEGPNYHLRGSVLIETTELQIQADEVDYNKDTGAVEARGHVRFEHFTRGEHMTCDRLDYNVEEETGKFYEVTGSAPARIEARPGLLTTQNPFYFEGRWAERLKDKYILHQGFLTDCLIPRPWWRLRAATFDVVPGDRAIARHAWFYVRNVPLFYAPAFYKSLEKQPRRSGFLTPNIGNSSKRGTMVGFGYYWAPSRSYDLTYRVQYFSERGFAHNVDLRGKVNQSTDFDMTIYGVNDTGLNGAPPKSGFLLTLRGKSELGKGWQARGELNYLSSFAFRQEFTESFHEAIFSETHSVGYVTKHWSDYGINAIVQRNENFQNTAPDDHIVLRKLPEVEFVTREHQVRKMPLWVSLDSSYGLDRRNQPLFQTRQFMQRIDVAPRVTTNFSWHSIELTPSFGIRETYYDSSFENGHVSGGNIVRSARDFTVDLALPPLSRLFDAPKILGLGAGAKLKHVIEPRATYRYVTGIGEFKKVIRFDEMDLLSNTNEVEFSLANRLLAKDHNGMMTELLSWQLWYKRYFDPTFGGAVIPGQRNVVESAANLTAYTFLDGYRRQSPVVSALRVQSRVGVEWRADYDPVRHNIVNSGLSVDGRVSKFFVSAGHNNVKSDPVLAPSSNQFRGLIAYGNDNRRGWNYGFSAYYDYRKGFLQYSQTQITYNTDCCGMSVQYRRFAIGTRNENQFRVAFAVSNIGSFGTLKRQERIF